MATKPPTITQLKSRINTEYAAANKSAAEAMQHVISCGEYLIQAKAKVEHGEWKIWVAKYVKFSYANATKYMKVAKHKELLAKVASTQLLTGVEPALEYIRNKQKPTLIEKFVQKAARIEEKRTKKPVEPAPTVDENGLNILDGSQYPDPEPYVPKPKPAKKPAPKWDDGAVDAEFRAVDTATPVKPQPTSKSSAVVDRKMTEEDAWEVVYNNLTDDVMPGLKKLMLQNLHPDKSGNKEDFDLVVKAFECLEY